MVDSINVGDIDKLDFGDLSPEDLASVMANIVIESLNETRMFEAVELQVAMGQFHILGRVREENEAEFMEDFGFPILAQVSDHAEVFLGKSYFLKEGKRRYGWLLSVGSTDLVSVVKDICLELEKGTDTGIIDIQPGSVPILGGKEPVGSVASGRKGVSLVPAGA